MRGYVCLSYLALLQIGLLLGRGGAQQGPGDTWSSIRRDGAALPQMEASERRGLGSVGMAPRASTGRGGVCKGVQLHVLELPDFFHREACETLGCTVEEKIASSFANAALETAERWPCRSDDPDRAHAVFVPAWVGLIRGNGTLAITMAEYVREVVRTDTTVPARDLKANPADIKRAVDYLRSVPSSTSWTRNRAKNHFLFTASPGWMLPGCSQAECLGDVRVWVTGAIPPSYERGFQVPQFEYAHPGDIPLGEMEAIWSAEDLKARQHALCLVGSPVGGTTSLDRIHNSWIRSCEESERCTLVPLEELATNSEHVVSTMRNSRFCMVPPRGPVTNHLVFDAMALGCIVVTLPEVLAKYAPLLRSEPSNIALTMEDVSGHNAITRALIMTPKRLSYMRYLLHSVVNSLVPQLGPPPALPFQTLYAIVMATYNSSQSLLDYSVAQTAPYPVVPSAGPPRSLRDPTETRIVFPDGALVGSAGVYQPDVPAVGHFSDSMRSRVVDATAVRSLKKQSISLDQPDVPAADHLSDSKRSQYVEAALAHILKKKQDRKKLIFTK
mmetsp:Transcript_30132/g.84167  ORF Transcript_30132/g.84167 Transcript_30132/m.84167 type:complete len:557 (-) Transcript_30132:4974-6644(-)